MRKIFKQFIVLILIISLPVYLHAQTESITPGNIYSSHFTIDDRGRDISYYIPLNYGANDHSLILVLADDNNPLQTTLKNYADLLHAKADSTGSIIMYPQPFKGHWHWSDSTYTEPVNDVGFISIMVDYFIQQHKCDPKQIYVIGFGSGGKMGCRLSCELHTGIAGAVNICMNDEPVCNCKKTIHTYYADTKKIKKQPGPKMVSNHDLAVLFDEIISHKLP